MTISKTFLPIVLILSCFISGCLKTRSQLKTQDAAEEAPQQAAPQANVRYEVEELRNEMTRLSGRVEELDHTQKQNSSQGSAESSLMMRQLEGRVSEIEKTQVLILSELQILKERDEEAKQPPVNVKEVIKQGYKLLKAKKYSDAEEKFRLALKKGAKSNDAAEANFGLGEAEFNQKNYKKAIVAYSKVQEVSAKSPLVASSLFKIGLSFQHLNMNKEAKGFFSDLIDRYPKSAEAKKAKGKMKD